MILGYVADERVSMSTTPVLGRWLDTDGERASQVATIEAARRMGRAEALAKQERVQAAAYIRWLSKHYPQHCTEALESVAKGIENGDHLCIKP